MARITTSIMSTMTMITTDQIIPANSSDRAREIGAAMVLEVATFAAGAEGTADVTTGGGMAAGSADGSEDSARAEM